jgi:alpha/beta superfamily hydrolase
LTRAVLEKAVTIALEGGVLALEGIYLAGEDDECMGAVVAAPHPLYGGSMDSPVVSEVAYACRKAGLASLRFNWRGVGASAGAPSGESGDADEDYSAATLHLEETVPAPLVAAGYSFGAAAAMRAAERHPRIRRLLLVSPPPALIDAERLARSACRTLIITGAQDAIASAAVLEPLAGRMASAAFHVIPEADHFYMRGLADVGRIVTDWL